jgi:hypothetical protein
MKVNRLAESIVKLRTMSKDVIWDYFKKVDSDLSKASMDKSMLIVAAICWAIMPNDCCSWCTTFAYLDLIIEFQTTLACSMDVTVNNVGLQY